MWQGQDVKEVRKGCREDKVESEVLYLRDEGDHPLAKFILSFLQQHIKHQSFLFGNGWSDKFSLQFVNNISENILLIQQKI